MENRKKEKITSYLKSIMYVVQFIQTYGTA